MGYSTNNTQKNLGGPVSNASKRLKKELQAIQKDKAERGREIDFDAAPVGDDLLTWQCGIRGPSGTPYARGYFKIMLRFPLDYPFKPPKVEFISKIYHCNILNNNVCVDTLTCAWTPAITIEKLLISFISLLADPNPNDPLAGDVAKVFRENRKLHDATAKKWTEDYALSDEYKPTERK